MIALGIVLLFYLLVFLLGKGKSDDDLMAIGSVCAFLTGLLFVGTTMYVMTN